MGTLRLSILGVGLLGGSLGLAAKRRINDCHVTGYGHRKETIDRALQMGAIDRGSASAAEAVRDADVVVLATPVGLFDDLLREIAPVLKPGAIVTDVGSTKRSIVRSAEAILPETVKFVGSHPMAGSEKRGVEFATADLFEGALCILTPTPKTDEAALETVRRFWKNLGMRLVDLSPDEHDRAVGEVSHLPHAVAAALVSLPQESSLNFAGKGFADATRIAGGDGGLWRDILLDNRDNVLVSLDLLISRLHALASLMKSEDGEALKQWLDLAAERRARMPGKSGSGSV
jgi:prephenate dehydrogenase